MKPLERLTNVEKAKLLFDLFPEAMPGLVIFMFETSTDALKPEAIASVKKDWTNQMIAADWWLQRFQDVNTICRKYKTQLSKSGRLFSDQLFDGYTAVAANHLVVEYTKVYNDRKFKQAVDLIFNP